MKILITGTSRGVGRALALSSAEKGHHVICVGRPSESQSETEALLAKKGASFESHACELASAKSIAEVCANIINNGAPDAIIHNAGMIERSPITEMSDDTWLRQLDINLNAPFRLTRALLPSMLQSGTGRVLFVSSISAVLGTKNQAAYHASKAGVVQLMRCLAEEITDTGAMTMALLPGSIDTSMLQGSGFPPRMTPEDVAKTLLWYAEQAPLAHNGAVVEMYGV